MLELQDVSIGYEGRAAVHGVSLAVEPGEVVAVVGPNGSGKSTLVRGVLGLADVLHGRLELFGQDARASATRADRLRARSGTRSPGRSPRPCARWSTSGRLPRKRLWERMNRVDRLAVRAAIDEVGLGAQARTPVGHPLGRAAAPGADRPRAGRPSRRC